MAEELGFEGLVGQKSCFVEQMLTASPIKLMNSMAAVSSRGTHHSHSFSIEVVSNCLLRFRTRGNAVEFVFDVTHFTASTLTYLFILRLTQFSLFLS
jgi:hypothetical protein